MRGHQRLYLVARQHAAPSAGDAGAEEGGRSLSPLAESLLGLLCAQAVEGCLFHGMRKPARVPLEAGEADDAPESGDGVRQQIFVTRHARRHGALLQPTGDILAPCAKWVRQQLPNAPKRLETWCRGVVHAADRLLDRLLQMVGVGNRHIERIADQVDRAGGADWGETRPA